MSETDAPAGPDGQAGWDDPAERDRRYAILHEALAASAHGRAFLVEHVRRTRGGDTAVLLGAIDRLERHVTSRAVSSETLRLRHELSDIGDAVRRIRVEIAEAGGGAAADLVPEAAGEPAPRGVERAKSDILEAAERIQEISWTMREGGFDAGLCDRLDQRATDIYAACTVQEHVAETWEHAAGALASLESRITQASRLWRQPARDVPLVPLDDPRVVLPQGDIDFVVVDPDGAGSPVPHPEPPLAASDADDRRAARREALAQLEALETLDTRSRLRLFT